METRLKLIVRVNNRTFTVEHTRDDTTLSVQVLEQPPLMTVLMKQQATELAAALSVERS